METVLIMLWMFWQPPNYDTIGVKTNFVHLETELECNEAKERMERNFDLYGNRWKDNYAHHVFECVHVEPYGTPDQHGYGLENDSDT